MPIGNTYKVSGETKATNAENREHESLMLAKRTIKLPSNQHVKIVYDADSNPIYVGTAPKGLPTGSEGWIIKKITWVSNNPTDISIGYGIWDDYLTIVYG